jgi:hypothetical protein
MINDVYLLGLYNLTTGYLVAPYIPQICISNNAAQYQSIHTGSHIENVNVGDRFAYIVGNRTNGHNMTLINFTSNIEYAHEANYKP